MGGSQFGWALGTIAPWWLGFALVLSMPADAGQDMAAGASLAPLAWRAPRPPGDLIPDSITRSGGGSGAIAGREAPDARDAAWGAMPRLLREASLAIGDAEIMNRIADEIEPRAALKRQGGGTPAVDRRLKGDPEVGVHPTFEAALRRPGGLAGRRAHNLLFEHDEAWPVGGLDAAEGDFAGPDSVAAFEPWPDGEAPTTAPSSAGASPRQGGGVLTMRPAAVTARLLQGATPQVRRAEALGSTTPASPDSTPVDVALAAPRAAPQPFATPAAPPPDRQAYAARIGGDDRSDEENRCLAEAIYFEARNEPEEGQAAVAQVVLNRVSSGLYPDTICGVVYQNRRHRNACQFSFACDGRSLRVNEPEAWRTAVRIAAEVAAGRTYVSDVGQATHYHANYVRPRWARSLEMMDVIGHHIFYRLRPGQT